MSTRVTKVFDATRSYSPSFIPAKNTALLLLDYQILTVSRLGEAGTRCVAKANDLKTWARTKDISVFHCVVDVNQKPTSSSRIVERWSAYETMIQQKPGIGDEPSELGKLPDEQVFPRRPGLVSALSSPGILEALRARDIKSLILCGLSTSGCVLSTARTATEQDFIVTVAEDTCADPVPGLHEMLVNHVFPMTAHVAMSEEIKRMWDGSD